MDFFELELSQIIWIITGIFCCVGVILYLIYLISCHLCLEGLKQMQIAIKKRKEEAEKTPPEMEMFSSLASIQEKLGKIEPEKIATTIKKLKK